MECFKQEYYESIEKALKEVGLKVDKIERQREKTIITVLQCETGENTVRIQNKQRIKNE